MYKRIRNWKHLPVVAYLTLSFAVAASFGLTEKNSAGQRDKINDARKAADHQLTQERIAANARLVEAIRRVATKSCLTHNETRTQLRIIVQRGNGNIKRLEAEGSINHHVAQESLKQGNDALKRLRDVDCKQFISDVQG